MLVAGFVIAYLAAGGVTLALGDRVTGGSWLAVHLVLLGAATNAIVVWSEHFAAALLRAAPVSERTATARALALNLGVLAVLGGVQASRPVLTAAGAWLVGAVVLAHAIALGARIGRALTGPLAGTVWFYVAASAALLAGMGLGVLLASGAPASADAYRAMRLARAHLNVLGWVGLAVVGTQFTLWPTVLRTRMVPGVQRAVHWSLATMVVGLAAITAGLLGQTRVVALAGLAGYGSGWPLPWARSCGRCCAAGRTRRHPGCFAPVWAGWPSQSSSTWSPWPAARRSSISTSGSTGWFRPSWSALPSRC